MKDRPIEKPDKLDALGIVGYLIVVNRQIHSYQINAINEYLHQINLTIDETPLREILSGSETQLPYNTALEAFRDERAAVQKDILHLLFVVASVDNSIDSKERKIIDTVLSQSQLTEQEVKTIREQSLAEAQRIRTTSNTLFSREKPVDENEKWYRKLIRILVEFIKRFFNISSGDEIESLAYEKAIQECCKTALEDFEVVKPSYESVIDACDRTVYDIKKYKEKLPDDTDIASDVTKAITVFTDNLKDNVVVQNREAKKSFEQKERTISDFTISLLGRTKAGKTTLHTILTNQGRENIGEGKQRTTRYNRVFQWNLLRIIDTPGIGSPEAAGRTDDEIAMSVLGESDIICFVVVDDSILKDVLDFIEKIALLNKPIVILLNHKDNIRADVKYRRFMENPKEWLNTTGESSLNGHIDRIRKYAEERGFAELIQIFPVFLLAALMSTQKEYASDSDVLWESSNIECFIEQLKEWITFYGPIKRSQTLIDEAIHSFDESRKGIAIAEAALVEDIEKMKSKKETKIASLKKAEARVVERIGETLKESFQHLARNEALVFAEEAYDTGDASSEHWEQFLSRIGIEEEINDAIDQELNIYREKANEVIRDVFEEFYFSVKNTFNTGEIKIPIQIDIRSTARIAGGVMGLVGTIVLFALGASNPIGWIVSGIGAILEFGASFITSREKKRQNEINKIYASIRKSIESNVNDEIENTKKSFSDALSKKTTEIEEVFEQLIVGLEKTVSFAEQLKSNYECEITKLNSVYALRILEFLTKNNNRDRIVKQEDIVSVKRSKERIIISSNKIPDCDPDVLKGVIAEHVMIERGKSA